MLKKIFDPWVIKCYFYGDINAFFALNICFTRNLYTGIYGYDEVIKCTSLLYVGGSNNNNLYVYHIDDF